METRTEFSAFRKNQFRRDPISGQWCIILNKTEDLSAFINNEQAHTRTVMTATRYSVGNEKQTPPEIFAVRAADSKPNDVGWSVRVLPMTEPFLQIHGDLNLRGKGMYDLLDGIGAHELVIESPRANMQWQNMEDQQILNILLAYQQRIIDLKRDHRFRYIMVHKNYGNDSSELSSHPHTHIIGTPITPARVKEKLTNYRKHYVYKERCLFCDIIFQELADNERIVLQNEHFVTLTPFASRAPFSMRIAPKKHETFFEWNEQFQSLVEILRASLGKLAKVVKNPGYIMVLHTGPNIETGKERGLWQTLEKDYHWHIEITPTFKTYTNFELGSGFQVNMVSPERAAKILQTENLDY